MTVSRWAMSDEEWNAHREFQLTPGEARAFVKLRRALPECAHHEVLHADRLCRNVLITSLRNKLRSAGYRIENVRGVGYRLTDAKPRNRARIESIAHPERAGA